MKSIRLKLVLMYIALVFIVIISCGTFTIISIQQNEDRKSERELSDAANKIIETVISVYEEDRFHGELVRNMSGIPGIGSLRIECNILDTNIVTLATNVKESSEDMPKYTSSVINSALIGESKFSSGRKYPDSQGKPVAWMEYARPVFDENGAVEYVIYLRINASEIYDSIMRTTQILATGLLIALTLAVVLGIVFANSLTGPIALLTRKAKEFAKGSFDQRIAVASKDEIGQLTDSFNNMAKDLSKSISDIESEKNKLEIVLHNMTDGVLAYDSKGRLIHGNHVCGELLGFRDIDSLTLDEMLTRLEITRPDAKKLDSEKSKDILLNISDRFINATCNYYKDNKGEVEGFIIVLQDLTKRTMLDNMRKEFVANVSHELRTPLTTIKSYVETLIDEVTEAYGDSIGSKETGVDIRLDFLDTIDGEADRMTHLVNDLLELSRLDNKQLDFNMETVNLVELVRRNIEKRVHFIEKNGNGHSISFKPQSENMPVKADAERVNQVIDNIISNSLRYGKGAVHIEVIMDETDIYYRIIIKDNGVGIPAEDLDRIFERFYRVDKARSRELGGTGLGLSISKEIIESHGGTLTAESRLNAGTIMTVSLLKTEPTNRGC